MPILIFFFVFSIDEVSYKIKKKMFLNIICIAVLSVLLVGCGSNNSNERTVDNRTIDDFEAAFRQSGDDVLRNTYRDRARTDFTYTVESGTVDGLVNSIGLTLTATTSINIKEFEDVDAAIRHMESLENNPHFQHLLRNGKFIADSPRISESARDFFMSIP